METLFDAPTLLTALLQTAYFALVGLAVFLVVFGIVKFIAHADDETERKNGRAMILWGIFSIFVIVSIWGFVNIIRNTLDLDDDAPAVPQLRTGNP